MKLFFALPLLFALALGCSKTEAADARDEAGDLWTELRAYGADRKEAFVERVGAETDRLESSFDTLDGKLSSALAKGGENADDVRAELNRRVSDLKAKLTQLAGDSGEAWETTRASIVRELKELQAFVTAPTKSS